MPLWVTLGGSAAYVAFMVTVGRRLLRQLESRYAARGKVTQDMIAVLMVTMLASAWITEQLGIHALFGAFLVGAVSPKSEGFVHAILERFEDVMVVLLLPLFFAFTGLRTEVTLIDGAARLAHLRARASPWRSSARSVDQCSPRARSSMPWREAATLGVLLNTRGLMELVILNVGLDIGVISRELFAMMVLMALATTFMTTPLVAWLLPLARGWNARPARAPHDDSSLTRYRIEHGKRHRVGEPGSRTRRSSSFLLLVFAGVRADDDAVRHAHVHAAHAFCGGIERYCSR